MVLKPTPDRVSDGHVPILGAETELDGVQILRGFLRHRLEKCLGG